MLRKSIVVLSLFAAAQAFAAGQSAVLPVTPGSALASQIQAMGGDFGAGNGGDGLELSHGHAIAGDVVIPPPGDSSDEGTLLVEGTPGANQPDDRLLIWSCKTVSGGRPAGSGCVQLVGDFRLNHTIPLAPALYLVAYSDTFSWTQVTAGEAETISLRKIQVPATATPMEFEAINDMTDPSMQDLYLKIVFTLYNVLINDDFAATSCKAPVVSAMVPACTALRSDNYQRLRDTMMRFNPDGSVTEWDFADASFDRSYFLPAVAAIGTGQFVSVFPGTYGILFFDLKTGKRTAQLGIKVE